MPNPLYDLKQVFALVKDQRCRIATHDAVRDIDELGLSQAEAKKLILSLLPEDHRKVMPDCGTNFGDVDCDDYIMWIDAENVCRVANGQGTKVYIKLGISATRSDGTQCLVVSFHESKIFP